MLPWLFLGEGVDATTEGDADYPIVGIDCRETELLKAIGRVIERLTDCAKSVGGKRRDHDRAAEAVFEEARNRC